MHILHRKGMVKIKYTEFEARVKEIPEVAEVDHRCNTVYVRNISGDTIFHISGYYMRSIYTIYDTWRGLSESTQAALYKLAYELTTTPLEEREEPKKYYYRLPFNIRHGNYLNYETDGDPPFYCIKEQTQVFQTQFTHEEYAAIANKHGIPDGYHIEEEVTDDE